jgi:hypothetical protein
VGWRPEVSTATAVIKLEIAASGKKGTVAPSAIVLLNAVRSTFNIQSRAAVALVSITHSLSRTILPIH